MPNYDFASEISIDITKKCNASCRMCWRNSSDGRDTSSEVSFPLIEGWKDYLSRVASISWWGDGEPFMYSDIEKLLEFILLLPQPTHLFSTNGRRLAEFAPVLARANLGEMIISIDGATSRTLEKIRVGVKLDEIIRGIQELQFQRSLLSLPPIRFRFLFVSMVDNVSELPLLVKLAWYLRVAAITVTPLVTHTVFMNEWQCKNVPGLEREFFLSASELANSLNIEFKHTHPGVL